ncbi:MAG: PASTA domain-containing protein [Prevotella sp.]
MKSSEFFGKFRSSFVWWNILAMIIVVVLIFVGVKYGLNVYTHHGEAVVVPDLRNMSSDKARLLIEQNKLNLVVSDSGYNKALPADCILAQTPGGGSKVKSGHVIYVTVNSTSSPTVSIPDLVDNSSMREAEAKLSAMGFKLLPPIYVPGEKGWLYGIICRGRRVSMGERLSTESPLTLEVGSGTYEDDEDIDYTEPEYDTGEEPDVDEFEVVTEPPSAME